ncbi:MAG TPA: endolytic transglycosylase MltG [Armatimonadota bacterium]|nr:endolytic transglycosylase MltG [Armatimonadota bacterium]
MVGALVLLVLACGVAVFAQWRTALRPVDPADTRHIRVQIDPGTGARGIAERLERAGVIRSALWFRLAAARSRQDVSFKAGDYVFQPSMRPTEIMRDLVAGRSVLVPVTVPEGYTLRQIADRLSDAGVVDANDFLAYATQAGPAHISGIAVPAKSLEGYLFPDTYFFREGEKPAAICALMIERLGTTLARYQQQLDSSAMPLHEVLTLASIVEREAKVDDERPIIAQVFLKRLELGWKLQSCATVQYLLDAPKPTLSYRDLAIESPYNTYRHAGLPPGPIGSPGEACIAAVLNPAKTDYLFFRTQGTDGRHHFSKSASEHEAAGT